MQLSAAEVKADLAALGLAGGTRGTVARAPLQEGQAWVALQLQVVDDAHMPTPPLRESRFEPPEERSHGHPLQPATQRAAVVWPPPTLTLPQRPASGSVSERPQRTARRPVRFNEEVMQGRTRGAVAEAFGGAAAGAAGAAPAALPPRPGWVPTLLPFPGTPQLASSGQADSLAGKPTEQHLPRLRPTTPTQSWPTSATAAAAAAATESPRVLRGHVGVDAALSHGLLPDGRPPGWGTGNGQHDVQQAHDHQQQGGGQDAAAQTPLTWQQLQTVLLHFIANSAR